jgi:hypothetical protein
VATSGTFILQNFIYQWGLKTQTWVHGLDRRYVRPYASIIIGSDRDRRRLADHQTAVPDRHRRRRRRVALVFAINPPFAPDRRHVPRARPFRVMRRIFGDPSTHMTEHPQRRLRVPPPFPALAYLYRPLTHRPTAIVEADDRWAIPTGAEP